MPGAALVHTTTTGKSAPIKLSTSLDVRSTFSNTSAQEPTTILVAVPSNNPILDDKKIQFTPTEAFKTIVSEITEALLLIISPISYEAEMMLLQLEYLKQEHIDAAATYKASMPHPKKSFLIAISVPVNIPTFPPSGPP